MRITAITTFIFIGFYLLIGQKAYAEDKIRNKLDYRGFSGGMMLHTGYVQGRSYDVYNELGSVVSTEQMKGFPYGIGGTIKIHFGKYLRVGSEGYVSNLEFKKNGSFSSVGWGGVLVDCVWQKEKVSPFVGVTIGGGSVKNLTMQGNHGNNFIIEQNSLFRKYGFMAVRPFVGVECLLTSKIRMLFAVDYLLNATDWQDDFVNGPRIFVGFVFYRLKN